MIGTIGMRMSKPVWVIRRKIDNTYQKDKKFVKGFVYETFGEFVEAKVWTHKSSAKAWITSRNQPWNHDQAENYSVVDCLVEIDDDGLV